MKIVIKISDETYKHWKEVKPTTSNIYMIDAIEGIRNGTPLPKHHGRLIDADAVDTRYSDPEVVETLNDAPTIIEAEGSDSK